jgi:type IV pilus biogenesis protein CpaD/CtpE
MNTKPAKSVLAAAAVLLATACTENNYLASTPDNFGEASRQTLAAQIIDPDPQYGSLVPATSGDHAQDATDRYRAGTVRKPERQTTTSGTGSSSGSSGSGGA